jgi:hypothetical protein
MSNPTSNFNWQMPTSTDLVTDLPADFEVFGQAVDTSLADLKGGTTNQVLAKNSNTDMDFKWVADAGFSNPMTTTGDIIYSSGGSTPARLGIGTTGQVLNVTAGIPAWTTPAAGGSLTLLSTTSLSGSTTTVSSIDQTYEYLYIQIADIVFSTGAYIMFKPNGNNPNELTFLSGAGSTGGKSDGNLMGNSTSGGASYITINLYNYKNTSEEKNFDYYTTFGASVQGAGFVKSDSAITSISLVTSTGTFTGGTMRIYGVK